MEILKTRQPKDGEFLKSSGQKFGQKILNLNDH